MSDFVLLALISVGPDFGFKRVEEHFLDNIVCQTCGAEAEGARE